MGEATVQAQVRTATGENHATKKSGTIEREHYLPAAAAAEPGANLMSPPRKVISSDDFRTPLAGLGGSPLPPAAVVVVVVPRPAE